MTKVAFDAPFQYNLFMSETSDVSLNKYFVYILNSQKDHKLYIGYTTNLESRLIEHKFGRVTSTKNRRPLQLILYEAFIDKSDALAREKFLKSGFGREQMKKAMKSTLANLDYKNL